MMTNKSDAFGYDYSNQMTAASYGWNWNGSGWVNPSRSANYTLDLVGNRNQVSDSAIGTWNYAPNNLNQYTSGRPKHRGQRERARDCRLPGDQLLLH